MSNTQPSLKELAKDAIRLGNYGGIGSPSLKDNMAVYADLMTRVSARSKSDWERFKQEWADYLDKQFFAQGIVPDSLTKSGFALRAVYRSSVPELNLALKYNQSLTTVSPQGRTALMRAASRGLAEITYLLVKAGAPIEAKDMHGCTAFFLALKHGFPNTAEILLRDGNADVTARATVTRMTGLQTYVAGIYGYTPTDKRVLHAYRKIGLDFDYANSGTLTPRDMLLKKLKSDDYNDLFN